MDPVSAIGVAAAVVQFVDFGKRLVSRAHQIQASPVSRTERESELLLSLSELREQAVQAKQTFGRFPEAQSDQKLARIFDDVEAAANEFDAMLEGLRSRSEANAIPKNKDMLQSLSVGLDSIRAEKQVQKALSRLNYIQRRGYSFTLSALWYYYRGYPKRLLGANHHLGKPQRRVATERHGLERSSTRCW